MNVVQPLQAPPPYGTPITDSGWIRWLNAVYEALGKGTRSSGPQAAVPQLQIGATTFSANNDPIGLCTVDRGLYVNYSSTVDGTLFGMVANITRARGAGNVVGFQSTAWSTKQAIAGYTIYAMIAQAVSRLDCDAKLVTVDASLASFAGNVLRPKIGINVSFKDRINASDAAPSGLGSNQYNYWSQGIRFDSQARSSSTEFCGWNVGIDMLDAFDTDNPPAWSNTTAYIQGQVVTNAGKVFKAKRANTNVAPPVAPFISADWACVNQYTTQHFAIGMDFSGVSDAQLNNLWSTIRLRRESFFSWEETGTVNTWYDSTNARLVFSTYNGAAHVRFLELDVGAGTIWTHQALTALGGGAAATLGTIGGAGPAVAAQNSWLKLVDNNTGTAYFVPAWR